MILYEKQDSNFAKAMLDEALKNNTIKRLLAEIAARVREEVLQTVIFHEQDGLVPSLNSLAIQHASGDLYIGALLPWYSKEFLNNTVEGRSLLLDALDQCLQNAASIRTHHDFLALMKTIDGMAYMYDLFKTKNACAHHDQLKDYIAPTADEVAIRRQRPEDVLAVTYGIGTELNKDLFFEGKAFPGTISGKARFFITTTEHRAKTWFEKLVDQRSLNKPSLPLIASTSNSAAKAFMMAHGLTLFLNDEQQFDLDKAQIFSNCVMAYLVYCGHHSCIEVMEVWNRSLDYLAIEHPEQMKNGLVPSNLNTSIPYIDAEDIIEKKLPYAKIGSYSSFLHPSYANAVMQRMETILTEVPDLTFNEDTINALSQMHPNLLHMPGFSWEESLTAVNRGMYPSFFGMINHQVVRVLPRDGHLQYTVIDVPNADGNLRKHCLYQSRLAKLICEKGRDYWGAAYQKINYIFLMDFDIKSATPTQYERYFKKIESSLRKINLFPNPSNHIAALKNTLHQLFDKNFDLANVSQFYYDLWLETYGAEPLTIFTFSVDELKEKVPAAINVHAVSQACLLLSICQDIAHNFDAFKLAYFIAQPYVFCGPPQLRGRISRNGSTQATTSGILRDDDLNATELTTVPHFAAKAAFQPQWEHPIAQKLQELGAPIIGGPSGTLGRNVLMLAPLLENHLLTQEDLMQYIMGFWADLVNRGHHSFEEVAMMVSQLLFPFKAWLDPVRTPYEFYEQLLTPSFLNSTEYQVFLQEHKDFFETPVDLEYKWAQL